MGMRPAIPLLIDFIEAAENQAVQLATTHGAEILKDNPEMMGTTVDMLRRTALVLKHIADVPANKTLLVRYHDRLLALVMSSVLHSSITSSLADVLFNTSDLSGL